MLDPLHVTVHDILATELAPFPAFSPLESTQPLTHVFVYLCDVEDQAAFSALLVVGAVLAVPEQVVGDLTQVDAAHALLAADQDLALAQEVLALVHALHVHEAVVAGGVVAFLLLLIVLLAFFILLPISPYLLLPLLILQLPNLPLRIPLPPLPPSSLLNLRTTIPPIHIHLRRCVTFYTAAIEVGLLAVLKFLVVEMLLGEF